MSDEEPGCHMRAESYEVEYASVDGDKLAAYVETKHNLNALLGCDTVPDFEPAQDETKCSEELQAKFQQWFQLKEQGANFNEALMRNKTFRNPNIYRWLVDHLQLEEAGTNLQSDGRFDPARLRNDFSAKGLADEQERRAREYAARKAAETSAAKAAGTTRNIQFQSA
ncbi:SAP30-binding protein, partial [Coemansia sp. RSA 2618]